MKRRTTTIAAVAWRSSRASPGQLRGRALSRTAEEDARGRVCGRPGLKGGQDAFGPYDPVQNWPKPLAESLPNHEGWTWSQATDVFPESPDRVFVTQKGELPVLPTGRGTTWLPQIGPGIKFPVGGGVPLRETASATPSGGKASADGSDGRPGVDWRWEHVIVVFDRNGKMIEDWSQWDRIWGRPHDVEISPYDPEKNIWIVDADNHFVSKFSHDGKKRLLTLGTPGVPGNDDTHFARPTFMAFMDANTWYLADGYDNTRVIKYDMNGKKLLQWGEKGTPPNERRPGYFNSVHGIAVDPTTRRVYVNDRNNGRIQVFDENGKFLDQWDFGPRPPMNIHSITMGADGSSGPPTRDRTSSSPTTPTDTSSIRGARLARARAASGACTGSRPTKRAISTPPK